MRPLLGLALLAVLSCSSSPTEPGPDGTLTLRYGQATTIAGRRVTFTEVLDSRCPKTVVCAWAGDAEVRLESGSDRVALHTNSVAGPANARLGDVTITLLDVRPERISTDEVPKSDYVATLRVSSR